MSTKKLQGEILEFMRYGHLRFSIALMGDKGSGKTTLVRCMRDVSRFYCMKSVGLVESRA